MKYKKLYSIIRLTNTPPPFQVLMFHVGAASCYKVSLKIVVFYFCGTPGRFHKNIAETKNIHIGIPYKTRP